jgi:methylated-DNA-protein-cysteine methyltransferase-like protein
LGADRTFERRVLSIVKRVPVGRVTTYGAVATLAGRPRAARAVGNIMKHAREGGVPYHRVIAAGGRIGGYSNPAIKRALLAAEGLTVSGGRVRGFRDVCWPETNRRGSARRDCVAPLRRDRR